MKKIRDEQKGIIFIALIILVIAVVSVIFGVSLKSDFVKETLKDNQIVRVLFVVEDSDSSVLFSNLMIFDHQTKRAALVNLPGHVGSIFRSIGRTDKLKVILPQTIGQQPSDVQDQLIGVPNIVEHSDRAMMTLADASRVCNREIIDDCNQLICFLSHTSKTLHNAVEYAEENHKVVTVFYLD